MDCPNTPSSKLVHTTFRELLYIPQYCQELLTNNYVLRLLVKYGVYGRKY